MNSFSIKKLFALLLAGAMLLSLAACAKNGGEPENTQEAVNTQAAETEEVKPTEAAETEPAETEPAETEPAPTEPAETAAAMPSEWFIEEAWKLVQDINRIYGTDFTMEECEVRPAQWGEKSLRWHRKDPEVTLSVYFSQLDDGSWTTGMEHCLFYYEFSPDRVDIEKYGSDMVLLSGLKLDLTAEDLKKAGYSPDGGEGDIDMAAEYMANYVAGLFTALPDDNYFKCSDSGVSLFEKHVTPSYTHSADVALLPVDFSKWGAAYGDISDFLCGLPEYYGYVKIYMNIMAVRNADGSITVSLNWDE